MRYSLAALSLFTLAIAEPTVYLIRHGEKPCTGNGLDAQGEQRAQCLKNVFGPNSQYNIQYIMAEQPESDGKRERPYETVEPLAQELGLNVDTNCSKSDYNCVAQTVDSQSNLDGNILICWEHSSLSGIVQALGDNNPPEYPSNAFNIIWTDPYPYTDITSQTSENCPGLDGGSATTTQSCAPSASAKAR